MTSTLKFFVILNILLCAGAAGASGITANVDRNPVQSGESFRLTFQTEEEVGQEPDFSVLEKDFDILNIGRNSRMTFVNGQTTRKQVWKLVLLAKTTGDLLVPPVNFDGQWSPAVKITVRESAPASATGNSREPLFLEVETDTNSTWTGGQIVYTVRLVSLVGLVSVTFNALESSDPDAIIEKLGEDISYESVRNGIPHLIFERRFAVYPQTSGALDFKPILFQGKVSNRPSRHFAELQQLAARTLRTRSKSLSVTVKPIPPGIAQADWLPARQVALTENWSASLDRLKVGEPVTRTIRLQADGRMAAQIPDIHITDQAGIKQYRDQAFLHNTEKPDGITGVKEIRVALIPSQNGTVRLPAIEVDWWNTATGKKETATLPSKVLTATGAKPAGAPTVQTGNTVETNGDNTDHAAMTNRSFWQWLSLVLALGWVFTVALVLFRKRNGAGHGRERSRLTAGTWALRKKVLACSQRHDAQHTRDALLEWARTLQPGHKVNSLADVARHCPCNLGQAIQDLNAALYSPDAGNWDGKALSAAFTAFRPGTRRDDKTDSSALEPLYKT